MWQVFLEQWQAQSTLELVAFFASLLYIVAATQKNIWCWGFGLVSTVCYTVLFWQYELPYQAVLNAIYVILAIYGWRAWQKNTENNVHETKFSDLTYVISVVLIFGMAYIVNVGFEKVPSFILYLDKVVMLGSLWATYLLAQQDVRNWWFWILFDGLAAYLYWQTNLYLTAMVFVLYSIMAIYGWIKWQTLSKSMT